MNWGTVPHLHNCSCFWFPPSCSLSSFLFKSTRLHQFNDCSCCCRFQLNDSSSQNCSLMVPKRCSRVEPISPSTWAEPRSDYSEWEGQSTPCARYNHPPSQGIDLERTQLASRCRRSPVWPCNDWNIFGNKAQDMVTWNEVPWGPLDHDHARGCDIKTMAQSGLERLLSSKHVMLLFIYIIIIYSHRLRSLRSDPHPCK